MKIHVAFLMMLCLCLVFAARPLFVCGQTAGEPADKSGTTEQQGKAKVKATSTPGQSQKGEQENLQKEAKKMLRDLDKEITALGKQVKMQGSKLQAEAKDSWETLKSKQQVARKKVKELSSASGEAWEKAKSEVDSALDELRKAYDKAASYFK